MDISILGALSVTQCGIFFSIVFSIINVRDVVGDCPVSWTSAVELCIRDHAADYDAEDPYQQWLDSCRSYNESISCFDAEITACERTGGDASDATSIRQRMSEDILVLCGNNQTYWSYQKHSICMNDLEDATSHCIDQYTTDSLAAYDNNEKIYEYADDEGEDYRDEVNEHICRAFNNLLQCVKTVVKDTCGEDASDLYNDVILTQVPSHVTDACANHLSGSIRCSAPNAASALGMLAIVFLISHRS